MFTTRFGQSLALLTDLYQLTMACGHWQTNTADKEAVFHLSFRNNPFHGGFTIFCGLNHFIDLLLNLRFDDSDLAYLSTLTGADGVRLFPSGFLDYLKNLEFTVDVDSMPEGTVAFAHEPLVRIKGPILQCQLLETVLLNIVNFQTLIATKAARVRLAAGNKKLMEFGLRRAHGADGALSASWACFVGGVDSTSNVLAGKLFGMPVSGTQAHSWIMSFEDELQAFKAYADSMPGNCVFLVDTYDSIEGVKNAIEAGRHLKEKGHKLLGVRLDSGDLAYLSIEARRLLDAAGFEDAMIIASNDLDEHIIESLNDQGARIDCWAVGTKLITAYDQPALGGVYKLSAIRNDRNDSHQNKDGPDVAWTYKIKLSEQVSKISTPGIQQVRRFFDSDRLACDMIYDETIGQASSTIIDPVDFTRRKKMAPTLKYDDLLVPIFRSGKLVYDGPPIESVREYSRSQLARLHPTITRLLNPHQYPVGLEKTLHDLKTQLILEARARTEKESVTHDR